jgi:beta-glucanase (GH16 family)
VRAGGTRRSAWAGPGGRRLAAGLALAFASAGVAAQQASGTIGLPAGYKLVWADEFDGSGLPDPAKWAHDTFRNKDGWFNNEMQYYSAASAANAVRRDGVLVITARRETPRDAPDWGGQRYTSARLLTKGLADWTYGFFEVRARIACGKGTWPAIWMLGSQGDWPAGGELDIMEHIGHHPNRVFSSVHTAAGSGAKSVGGATRLPDVCSTFHNYQMHWTPQRVRFGIDGAVHAEYANPGQGKASWPFDAPQFMILNIAVGGDLGGKVDDRIFPVRMEVDHVRVHQRAP